MLHFSIWGKGLLFPPGLTPECLVLANVVTFEASNAPRWGFLSLCGFKKKPTVFLLSHLSFEVKKQRFSAYKWYGLFFSVSFKYAVVSV